MSRLYHYTKDVHVPSIHNEGQLWLEGENNRRMLKLTQDHPGEYSLPDHIKHELIEINEAYKLTGRYVWFTTNPNGCKTASEWGHDWKPVRMGFDKDDLKVFQWKMIKRKFKGKAKWVADHLDTVAKDKGDNPDDYWVSKKPVSLDNMLFMDSDR